MFKKALRTIVERPWLRISLAVALLVIGLAPVGAPILSDNNLRQALGAPVAAAAEPPYTYRVNNLADGTAVIQRSNAGSQDWNNVSTLPATVLQVAAPSGERSPQVFARTESDVWRSTDAGLTWSKVQALPSQPLSMAVAPLTDNLLLVGTAANGLFLSSDRGDSWRPAEGPLSLAGPGSLAVSAVALNPADSQVIYATSEVTIATPQGVHKSQNAFVSVDGARHWFQMTPAPGIGTTSGAQTANRLVPVANQPLAVAASGEAGNQAYQLKVTSELLAGLQNADPGVRGASARALGLSGDHTALPALLKAMHDTDLAAGDRAAEAVGWLGDRTAVDALMADLGDQDEAVRGRAAYALGLLKYDAAMPQLAQMLNNDGPLARGRAADGLAAMGTPGAIAALMSPLADADLTPARHAAMQSLETLGRAATPQLTMALRSSDPVIRRNAAETLGWINTSEAVPALAQALSDSDPQVRAEAAWALGENGTAPAQQALAQAVANEKDQAARQSASQALAQAQKMQAERAAAAPSPVAAFMVALSQVPASRWTLLFLVVLLAAILLTLSPRRTATQRA